MNCRLLFRLRFFRHIPVLILLVGLLVPFSESPAAQVIEVIVEDPQLHPTFSTCSESYWYTFDNNRGHPAYLTLNAFNPANSTNHGEWHPVIPQAGYYRVEAYIAGHPSITWCNDQKSPIEHDTTDTHYSIHHANGVSTRSLSQYPLSNQWLTLGEYYFNAGSNGYVGLTDLNTESEFSTTISFSAMRFTFTRLSRPQVYLPMVNHHDPSGQPPPKVGVIQGQGFDGCHLPEISEMQTWWSQSPYSFYALYLGGVQLPSICSVASATWVSAVHQQGWSFIPTWVGPQAPCSGWSKKMSADPAVSYQEGRQEAQAASTVASSMGLSNYDGGGTIIYYDMEVFGGASLECRQAASAFINGWVARLHELGNIAGGYGAHNSYVEDWATIANSPNDVWAASWYTNTYDAGASVLGISWLNGLWTNHQRIRQYAGDHNERWGGIKLTIDSDVADGVVAMPPKKPLASPIVTLSPSIEDSGWLSAEQGWLVSGNRLYWSDDQGENWRDISPAPIKVAYFLPSGQAWALSTHNQKQASLYHSTDWGVTWESLDLPLPTDSWRPLQLQFTSPTSGWVVLQKETSQAFSFAILMKTSDGGLTWQSYDLPFAAAIDFASQSEGWIINPTSDELYHTLDGGLTWQPAPLERYPRAHTSVLEGSILSGWQANSLGWAVTSTGSCSGEKSSPSFTCKVDHALWQTLDGGQTWEPIPLPTQ